MRKSCESSKFPKLGDIICFGNFEDSFPKQLNMSYLKQRSLVRTSRRKHWLQQWRALPQLQNALRSRGGKFALRGGVCAAFLLGYMCLMEPYWLRIRTITLNTPEVPAAFEGTRIAFIADIHYGAYFSGKRLQQLVATVNGLQPDIVIFGGDYFQWNQTYIAPCFAELQRIHAPLGKFGVLGNHDDWRDGAALTRQGMQTAEITVLDNQAVWIVKNGQRIKIGGVGDLLTNVQNLAPTIADVAETDFVILVSHNPEYAEQLHTRKLDVMLSGHTHGGQINFFGRWAPFLKLRTGQKYVRGMVDTAYTKVIISNGVGMVAVPARFCARPEIILVTLTKRNHPLPPLRKRGETSPLPFRGGVGGGVRNRSYLFSGPIFLMI